MPRRKKEKPVWGHVLRMFASKYFKDVPDRLDLDEASKRLATWFYDNTKQGALKKMIEKLPKELWTSGLEAWEDGRHDT